MTLAAKLEDFELTLEHLLMDVFVSKGFSYSRHKRVFPATLKILGTLSPLHNRILICNCAIPKSP